MTVTTTTATGKDVRVRFCPSPTGTPHVGLIRTALFNWAFARHHGGTFDSASRTRMPSAIVRKATTSSLKRSRGWVSTGMRAPEVGGPYAPYRQSQRSDLYQGIIAKLLEAGHLYESFVTPDEMAARNVSWGRDPKQGYDNHERDLTPEERQAFRDQGREPALRLRVPELDRGFEDLVRGEVLFPATSTTDFVLVRAGGKPLYTFVNPVDDALMGITHVLRGGGPALLYAPADCSLHGADRHRSGNPHPSFWSSAFCDGRGK